jgi:hypothetical protein
LELVVVEQVITAQQQKVVLLVELEPTMLRLAQRQAMVKALETAVILQVAVVAEVKLALVVGIKA